MIGGGNMGGSLIGGLLAKGTPAAALCCADPEAGQRDRIRKLYGIQVLADNGAAIPGADVVILAVKPQAMKEVVTAAIPFLERQRPLLISIAAGIPLGAIRRWLTVDLPMIRAMPNTPALIGAGAAALWANEQVTPRQRELAEGILRSVGTALWVDDEALLDAVTALSGSGPAYFFLVIEALEEAGVMLGLRPEQARRLTLETALGAARMALEGDVDPAALRRQVTSPGGTTERAIAVLERAGLARIFQDALRAARDRAAELAQIFGTK